MEKMSNIIVSTPACGTSFDRRDLRVGLAIIGMFVCSVASAQDAWKSHPSLQDRWMFQLGAYYPNVDTTASLNSSKGVVNAEVSFEDDLKLKDRKALPTILASVRLGQRWRIEAEYFSLHRSTLSAISRTINWGDNSYTIGTVVSGKFNSDIYRLSGGYSFLKDDNKELGVALGLHVTDFETALSASGVGASRNNALAPLPTIGLYGAYAFTSKWLLSGRVDVFSLNYEDYKGSLVNFNVSVDYRFARNFGVGLGYRYIEYNLDLTKTSYNGNVNYKFTGPMLYAVASF
jgi:hypothetical protein